MKNYNFFILVSFFLCFSQNSKAQILGFDFGEKNTTKQIKTDSIDFNNFSFNPEDTIHLNESNFYTVKLKTDLEKKYYLWLRKRVRDVWPYVRTAVREYNHVKDTIQTMDKKREQRKYIRSRQKELADKFENELKKMTVSRGQILTKLIYKETNKTVFEIIKELRGGLNAFLYQVSTGSFDIDLKQKFDPKKTREDLYIIVILQRDFHNNILKPIEED